MKTIGIPRGMMYYEYYPLWEEFFNNLNIKVVLSPKTNKEILNLGILSCVDEACLPIKIFHGHVEYLKEKVDYLFIPKIISLYKKEYCCPKHLGLPDMVKHSIKDLPYIISPEIYLSEKNSLRKAVIETGSIFTKNYLKIYGAFNKATEAQKFYKSWLSSEIIPRSNKNIKAKIRLLILGHSYNVFDEFINMGLLKRLNDCNIEMIFAEDVPELDIRLYTDKISKRMFWTHGRRIVVSAYSLIDRSSIDGIIYLSAFGCGLDSVLVHLVEKKAISNGVPIMIITLDEQTGEAGFITRFEAFLDMMEWRLKNENNISSFR